MTFGIFATSQFTARLYREKKIALAGYSLAVAVITGLLFYLTAGAGVEPWQLAVSLIAAFALGASLYGFSRLFTLESEEDRTSVAKFFKKLDTPVDVAREVYGAGRKQVSTMPLVGRTIIFMGLLVSAAFFTPLEPTERAALIAMTSILLAVGGTLWIAGKRLEWKEAQKLAAVQAAEPIGIE
jgi:hypothetical protein